MRQDLPLGARVMWCNGSRVMTGKIYARNFNDWKPYWVKSASDGELYAPDSADYLPHIPGAHSCTS